MDTAYAPFAPRSPRAGPFAGRLSLQVADALRPHGGAQRTRIWEIGASLHCSIVGMCLPASDLRALVRKFGGLAHGDPTDHEVHGIAVSAVARRDLLAKQIQKALDRRHAVAIKRFHSAACARDVLTQWRASLQIGDVPGGYWAALTHPMTDEAAIKQMFGEVHMLSHQIGAANRADMRRLHQLEQEKAALADKIDRQERRLREGISSRDARIRELTSLVSSSIAGQPASAQDGDIASRAAALEALVGDLRRQLDREITRRKSADSKVEELSRQRTAADQRSHALEQENAGLGAELESAEARLAGEASDEHAADLRDFRGLRVLYVGGRPNQVRRLRAVIEGAGGELVHHDGGLEERAEMLYGLASHADLAVFPIDCVSHTAVQMIKRVCRRTGKPLVPLRSSGVTAFLHGLRTRLRPLATAEPAA